MNEERNVLGTNNQPTPDVPAPRNRHVFWAGAVASGLAETVGTGLFLAAMPPEARMSFMILMAMRGVPMGVIGAVVGGTIAQEVELVLRQRRR